MNIRDLQQKCWQTAEDKGFHEDHPKRSRYDTTAAFDTAHTNWVANKLLLVVSEVVEAHDELRDGKKANVTYYPTKREGCPGPFKPEGVPSELADAVIRILDLAETEGIDLQAIIEEKMAYNETRERLHGRKF